MSFIDNLLPWPPCTGTPFPGWKGNRQCERAVWSRHFGAGLALLVVFPVLAGDWPQWRGPNRDAVWTETGMPEAFPPDGLKVRWRAAIGPGHSSPVVAGGLVYITDSEKAKPRAWERVLCFDERTGKRLWMYSDEVTLSEAWFNPNNKSGPIPTPVVSKGKIVTLGSTGHLVCLDARTGRLVWKRDLAQDFGLGDFAELTPCPLIEGGLVIAVIGGKPGACVVALDIHTGKEVWRALDDPYTFSSPTVIHAGGRRQFIVWTPKAVTSLDPATGKTWWREELITREDYAVATPVYADGRLAISGLMFQLDPGKPAARIVWPETKNVSKRVLSHTCMPLILGECVYGGKMSGHLICLDAHTGNQLWETDQVTGLKSGATIHMTVNGSSVLIFTDQGNLLRARLTPKGYEELSRTHLIDPDYTFGDHKVVWAVPAYAHKHVFARNYTELVCVSMMPGL